MRHAIRTSLSAALCIALAGCGGGGDGASTTAAGAAKPAKGGGAQDSHQVAMAIADTLQACSYDGTPVKFGIGGDAPTDCRDMIAQVMNFTGLPQNFVVGEAEVPNAAAAILLDEQKIPQRVIGFNPQFIDLVRQATGGNAWGAVSVMAHEAGHHLAGHTIQPGGSQPPIELEADKFSGFVLYKMGASRNDALMAIQSLVPEEVPAGASHPPRARRVAAITEGWDQACQQTGRADCAGGTPGSAPPPGIVSRVAQSPASRPDNGLPGSPRPPVDGGFDRGTPPPAAGGATTLPTVVVLPQPDPKALPTKGMQFVYDETGLLDKATVAKMEKAFFDHAREKGVEIVSIFARDLGGLTPEQYAWAMMRQLRVGKLDVGNGVVIVWNPATRQGGVAMGPGVRNEMAFHIDRFPSMAKMHLGSWDWCVKQNGCDAGATENFFLFADNIRRDTGHWDWTVRYQSLGAIQQVAAAENEVEDGVAPKDSKVWRKLVKLTGTVVQVDPAPGGKKPFVNEPKLEKNGRAIYVKTDDGLDAVLYFHPETEGLMPAGTLQQGKQYSFIARESGLSWNPQDDQALELYSYDLMQ